MNGRDLLYSYPFWGPDSSGPAKDFARPTAIAGGQLNGIENDSERLRVPQETVYNNTYLDTWQWNPIIIAAPQAPVQVPDTLMQSQSLYAYAMATMGGGGTMQANAAMGNAGKANITNG